MADVSTADNFLVAAEIYFTNQNLAATPPGRSNGRKVLAGQTDPKENGLYPLGWDEENAVATWGDRICPTGFLVIRVGDGENAGQNAYAGLYSIDGAGKVWGTDPIAVRPGAVRRFVSTVQTGTGSEESIAHGLGLVPSLVIVEIRKLPALSDIATTPATLVSKGAHTSTHLKITALAGLEFTVTAIP